MAVYRSVASTATRRALAAALLGVFILFDTAAWAKTVTLGRTETSTDYVSAGVGGIGNGPGTITVTGVTGPVRKAFLYWHGIDQTDAAAVYDNPSITFAGTSIRGVSLGDSGTNCWGAGSSRAFFADVTSLVDGNGSYVVDELDAKPGHNGNGASLVVLFDDGNDANDRDLVFFEGNDTDSAGFPDDPSGWAATLANIAYGGGSVFAQIHASDGQSFSDASIQFAGVSTVTIPDTLELWDGKSVPNAGFSRAGTDSLWDIHTFEITAAFGSPGTRSIDFTGMIGSSDCHGLVVLMLDLEAGSAPCGNGTLDEGEECDPAGSQTSVCSGAKSCLNDCSCGCTNDFQCNDGAVCTTDSCNVETGACLHASTCASGPGCTDTCDAVTATCRQCGRPFRNDVCIANAVFVLQGALDLRPCQLCLCDVDASETVTVSDALRILRNCAGVPVSLECIQVGDAGAP
jgi:hypothetical protein